MNEFNYKDSINGIKASLFDIYEDQEQVIGLEQNPKIRNARLTQFIEVKNMALMLLEGINNLYDEDIVNEDSALEDKLENPQIPSETEESQLLSMVENSTSEVTDVNEYDIEEEPEEEISDNELEFNEEDSTNIEEIETSSLKKYYLNCDLSDVNFAYVPQGIFQKIKNNGSNNKIEENINDEIEEESNDLTNTFMKQDKEKAKGIIVRSDQYMKLALSKYRQEGVLREAKAFRIEEVKRKRIENQKKELEKAEVKIDI